MACSPPGSSVHGIFQARILKWVAFSLPGDLPSPGINPASPALAGGFFTTAPSGNISITSPLSFPLTSPSHLSRSSQSTLSVLCSSYTNKIGVHFKKCFQGNFCSNFYVCMSLRMYLILAIKRQVLNTF